MLAVPDFRSKWDAFFMDNNALFDTLYKIGVGLICLITIAYFAQLVNKRDFTYSIIVIPGITLVCFVFKKYSDWKKNGNDDFTRRSEILLANNMTNLDETLRDN